MSHRPPSKRVVPASRGEFLPASVHRLHGNIPVTIKRGGEGRQPKIRVPLWKISRTFDHDIFAPDLPPNQDSRFLSRVLEFAQDWIPIQDPEIWYVIRGRHPRRGQVSEVHSQGPDSDILRFLRENVQAQVAESPVEPEISIELSVFESTRVASPPAAPEAEEDLTLLRDIEAPAPDPGEIIEISSESSSPDSEEREPTPEEEEPRSEEQVQDAILNHLDPLRRDPALKERLLAFFNLTKTDDLNKPCVQLRHARCPLFFHQAAALYHGLMVTAKDARGFYLADSPGTGKTLTLVALTMFAGDLRHAARHAEADPDPDPDRPHSRDVGCPWSSTWGFQCPCTGNDIVLELLRLELPRDGPSLILTQPHLTRQFLSDARNYLKPYNEDDESGALVFSEHNTTADDSRELLRLRPKYKAAVSIGANVPKAPSPKDREKAIDNLPWIVQGPASDQPPLVIIQSVKSLHALESAWSKTAKFVWADRKREDSAEVLALVPGVVCLDEFHEYTKSETNVIKFLRRLKRSSDASAGEMFTAWSSATPLSMGPIDLQWPMALLEQGQWEQRQHPLHLFTSPKLSKIAAEHTALVRKMTDKPDPLSKEDREKIVDLVRRQLAGLSHIMIRRVTQMTTGLLRETTIDCAIPGECIQAIQGVCAKVKERIGKIGLEEGIRRGATVEITIATSFPHLAGKILLGEVELNSEVLLQELKAADGDVRKISLWRYRGQLDKSDKAQQTKAVLKRALVNNTEKTIDGTRVRKKKVIWYSKPTMMCAALVLMAYWSETDNELRGLKYKSINRFVKDKDRQDIIAQFQSEDTTHPVLALTVDLGRSGLNLQRGNYMIIWNVLRNLEEGEQVKGRADRKGQLDVPQVYQFVSPGSPVDRSILSRSTARDQVSTENADVWQVFEGTKKVTEKGFADIVDLV